MKRKNKAWKLPALSAMGIIFACFSVFVKPSAEVKEPIAAPPQSSFNYSVAGIGVIEPKNEVVDVGVEVPGIVREVLVKAGDEVKKGDILFIQDTRDIESQIEVYKRSVVTAEIQKDDADASFRIVKGLIEKGSISKDAFDRRFYAAQLAQAKLEETKAQLLLAETTKDRLHIRAPSSGTILEVNIRAGEYAVVSTIRDPLIRMGDTSVLHARVEFDEELTSQIKPTSSAEGLLRGENSKISLTFVRFEPFIRTKQNLNVSGQKIDTRVVRAIYALNDSYKPFIGRQLDVFIDRDLNK